MLLPLALYGQPQQQNQGVPDAPTPQSGGNLGSLAAGVTPGEGATAPAPDATDANQAPAGQAPANQGSANQGPADQGPAAQAPASQTPDDFKDPGGPPTQVQPSGQLANIPIFRSTVNFVPIPVTVLDKKHRQVAGLQQQDFEILENGVPQHMTWFSPDMMPLSIALVIDQSLTSDIMQKVNQSLNAIQGAFSPYDSVAVFTYSDGVRQLTTFTAAQGARLPAVLETAKASGTDMQVPINTGAFASGPTINGRPVDPNVQPGRYNSIGALTIPKEVHTLNDAILEAAHSLTSQPRDQRRRIIYVISDGKESRSKASFRDVVHYLQSNQIQVFGTLVGDSATWGLGYLDKFKLPLLPLSPDNILPRYADATGGHLAAEFSENGIQQSFADLAALGHYEYIVGFDSKISPVNSSFRKIEVRVRRPDVDVIAPPGYYPIASDMLH
jgi:VWFA-related protein